MAKRIIETLVDDLDGSEATQTVEFGYRGKSYVLDLNETNAAELDEVLAPYIAAAQQRDRSSGARTRSTGRRR